MLVAEDDQQPPKLKNIQTLDLQEEKPRGKNTQGIINLLGNSKVSDSPWMQPVSYVVLVAEDVQKSTKVNLIQTQDEQKRLIHGTSKVSMGPWMQPECRPRSRGRPKKHQSQFDSNTG